MSIQAGAMCLEKVYGGKGVLLGGVPGLKQGHVVVLGAGVVGSNATLRRFSAVIDRLTPRETADDPIPL